MGDTDQDYYDPAKRQQDIASAQQHVEGTDMAATIPDTSKGVANPPQSPNLENILSNLLKKSTEALNKSYLDNKFDEAKASIEAMVLDIIGPDDLSDDAPMMVNILDTKAEQRQRLSERLK